MDEISPGTMAADLYQGVSGYIVPYRSFPQALKARNGTVTLP